MKSKLLLALFFGAAISLSAQKQEITNIKHMAQSKKQGLISPEGNVNLGSGARVDIWTNDFSVPEDWEFEDVAG